MKLLVDNEIDINKWNHLLTNSSYSSPFQTKSFCNFLKQTSGFDSQVFALDNNDTIKSLMVVTYAKEVGIIGHFSRRAIAYGGPLIIDISNDELDFFLIQINKYIRKKAIYFDIRNSANYEQYKDVFLKNGYFYHPYQNYILNIERDYFGEFNNEKRRQIRKSLKLGVKVKTAEDINEIETLYKILHKIYKEKVKKPLPELSFFINLFSVFKKDSLGYVTIIKNNEEKIIGGSFCLKYNNTAYDWYRGGLDFEYKAFYPSIMAAFAGMKFGAEYGLKKFDFMGAGKKGQNYGVRNFKSQFGGELVEFGRFTKVLNPFYYNLGKLGLKILSKIK